MFHWTGFTKSACAEMVEAVPPGSLQQDPSWECAWCGHVLPAINRISLRAGCKNHWKVCEGNNKPQKSNYWQKPRLFVVKQGYSCQRPQQRLAGRSLKVCCDFRTNQYNDSNSSNSEAHDLVLLKLTMATASDKPCQKYILTCRRCAVYWLSSTDLFQKQKHTSATGNERDSNSLTLRAEAEGTLAKMPRDHAKGSSLKRGK